MPACSDERREVGNNWTKSAETRNDGRGNIKFSVWCWSLFRLGEFRLKIQCLSPEDLLVERY